MAYDRLPDARRWLHRAAGALTWPLRPADYLAVLRGDVETDAARVESLTRVATDATMLTLRTPSGFPRHQAGQFVRLGVDIDGVRHWRCYSISSAPERDDGCITVTIKAVADGRVSRYVNESLQPGDHVQLDAPAGDFVLPERLPGRMLFIAAGSGITPIMSMLSSLDAQGIMPYITVIHSAPDAESMIYGAALAELAARHPRLSLHLLHTRQHGRFSPSQLEELCGGWELCETWACGPDAMLQALEDHWSAAGVSHRLHVERFRPRQLRIAGAASAGQVSFLRSACSAQGRADQPVLELAELNGLSPAHGCRMGICHGCTATLKSGSVRDLRTGKTYDEEGDLVQICVCAPVGPVEIDL